MCLGSILGSKLGTQSHYFEETNAHFFIGSVCLLATAAWPRAGRESGREGGEQASQLFLRSWLYCARPRMGSMTLGRKKLSLTRRVGFSRGMAGKAARGKVAASTRSSAPGPRVLRRLPRGGAGRGAGSGQAGGAPDALRSASRRSVSAGGLSMSRNSLSGSISDSLGS